MKMSGYILWMLSIIISKIINERGYRTISNAEKVRLMDGFSTTRAYSLIPLVVLICIFYLLVEKSNLDRSTINIGYFTLLVVYIVVRTLTSQQKMKALEIPMTYRKYYTLSQVIAILGVTWFLFTFLQG